jgi:nucleotide-binding universal stress UspA family protein
MAVGSQILVPLDGSELAEAALPYAAQLAKSLGWGAVLFSVVTRDRDRDLPLGVIVPVETTGGAVEPWPQAETPEARAQGEEVAMERMLSAEETFRGHGVSVTREVGHGDPGEVIVDRAKAADVAMIVIASHGLTGLQRLFRGSVATHVAHHTDRPTLVVRPFRDQDQRVHLEHADALPRDQAAAVEQVVKALGN